MQFSSQRPLVIWRFTDGKPGHEKQTLGLANALAQLAHAETLDFKAGSRARAAWNWLIGGFPEGAGRPGPDLILAAGHATHLPALAARRAHGGKIVALMKPSLPLGLFDLCLIPEHDAPPVRANVMATRGALNPVVPSADHDQDTGIVLIGGPSGHFTWDDADVASQVRELITSQTSVRWSLSTSRRTPSDFLTRLEGLAATCLTSDATAPGWLESRLASSGQAWITPDSVSMVYEALTAGCRVGLFDLAPRPESRVAGGVKALLSAGLVSSARGSGYHANRSATHLNESERCAKQILDMWFS